MKRKVIQLVHFEQPIELYHLYEAIVEDDEVVWISDEPIKGGVFTKYHRAVEIWGKVEKKYSGLLDIGTQEWYNELRAEIENQEEKELSF